MPGWDVTVRPAKEEKKKEDNTTWVVVVVLLALLLLLLYGGYGGGQQGVRDGGTGQGCVQRDGSRCDQGSGPGGHRGNSRGSGHGGEDHDPHDRHRP